MVCNQRRREKTLRRSECEIVTWYSESNVNVTLAMVISVAEVLTPHQHEGDSENLFSLCVRRDIAEADRREASDCEIDGSDIPGLKRSKVAPRTALFWADHR